MYKSLLYHKLKQMDVCEILSQKDELELDPNLPFKFVEETMGSINWNFNKLSRNHGKEFWFYLKYRENKKWNNCTVVLGLDIDDIIKYKIGADENAFIHYNMNLKPQDLIEYPDGLPHIGRWDMHNLAYRCDVIGFIDVIDFESGGYVISGNENIPLSFILKNPQYKWEIGGMSNRTDLTPEFVEEHMDMFIDENISRNPVIFIPYKTSDLFRLYLEKWDICYVLINKGLTIEYMIEHRKIFETIKSRILKKKYFEEDEKKWPDGPFGNGWPTSIFGKIFHPKRKVEKLSKQIISNFEMELKEKHRLIKLQPPPPKNAYWRHHWTPNEEYQFMEQNWISAQKSFDENEKS